MRWKVIPAALVALFLVCSCSSPPAPTARPTPTPTALACPAPQPEDPGFVASGQNRIVNGSFGSPSIQGHRKVTSLPGWTVTGAVELVAATSCLPFPDNQYASLSYGATLTQMVPTVPGTTYELSSSDSREGECSTAGADLDVYWNAMQISVDISLAQGTTPTGGPPPPPWGFIGTAGTEVIATSDTSEVRVVVSEAAVTCRFDVSNLSLVVKPKATPAA